jgi:hypothetical protein
MQPLLLKQVDGNKINPVQTVCQYLSSNTNKEKRTAHCTMAQLNHVPLKSSLVYFHMNDPQKTNYEEKELDFYKFTAFRPRDENILGRINLTGTAQQGD